MVRAFSIIIYTWLGSLNCKNNNFFGESFSRPLGSFCNQKVLKKIEKKNIRRKKSLNLIN